MTTAISATVGDSNSALGDRLTRNVWGDLGDNTKGRKRMSTKIEKVIVDTNLTERQNIAPNFSDIPLKRSSGSDKGRIHFRPASLKGEVAASIFDFSLAEAAAKELAQKK